MEYLRKARHGQDDLGALAKESVDRLISTRTPAARCGGVLSASAEVSQAAGPSPTPTTGTATAMAASSPRQFLSAQGADPWTMRHSQVPGGTVLSDQQQIFTHPRQIAGGLPVPIEPQNGMSAQENFGSEAIQGGLLPQHLPNLGVAGTVSEPDFSMRATSFVTPVQDDLPSNHLLRGTGDVFAADEGMFSSDIIAQHQVEDVEFPWDEETINQFLDPQT
ncbi:hypothetical protein FDECE_16942 [Fusarium decemcellulare]|nr:hypothetical protein FDECE_16942 [Fusarium decemcellulare]